MRNYYKTNSHYLTYTLSLKNVGRIYFLSLGVKGLITSSHALFAQSHMLTFKISWESIESSLASSCAVCFVCPLEPQKGAFVKTWEGR